MSGPRVKVGLIAAVVALAGLPLLRAQQQASGPNQEDRTRAVGIMRTINTAEVEYLMHSAAVAGESGRYGSWDEIYQGVILKNERLRDAANRLELSGRPDVMPGWQIKLVVSADGKSYSVALQDNRVGDGLFSVFSDQDGIIFLGSPIG